MDEVGIMSSENFVLVLVVGVLVLVVGMLVLVVGMLSVFIRWFVFSRGNVGLLIVFRAFWSSLVVFWSFWVKYPEEYPRFTQGFRV
jgi:hypothetical protein